MLILNLIEMVTLNFLPKLILTLNPNSLVLIQIASTLHSWTGCDWNDVIMIEFRCYSGCWKPVLTYRERVT